MISSHTTWHQDQHNTCITQSISWSKVTRLYHSANIALEQSRMCSKGMWPFFIISTTVEDQRLSLGLIMANMRGTCFWSASTLGTIQWWRASNWGMVTGVDLMLDRVSNVVVPWQWVDFLHFREMLNGRNRLCHWYYINLTEQAHIIVSCSCLTLVTTNGTLIWLGNQCATHQLSSLFQTNTARPSRICNCEVTTSSRKVTPSSGNRERGHVVIHWFWYMQFVSMIISSSCPHMPTCPLGGGASCRIAPPPHPGRCNCADKRRPQSRGGGGTLSHISNWCSHVPQHIPKRGVYRHFGTYQKKAWSVLHGYNPKKGGLRHGHWVEKRGVLSTGTSRKSPMGLPSNWVSAEKDNLSNLVYTKGGFGSLFINYPHFFLSTWSVGGGVISRQTKQ